MKRVFLSVILLLMGCGTNIQPLIDEAAAECVSSIPVPPQTYAERARCFNAATEDIIKTHQPPHADLIQLQEAYRLALAKKIDAGEISREDASVAFLEVKSRAISEIGRRNTEQLQTEAAGLMAGAALFNNIGPVTCYSSGQMTTCH
jgi:hypothetical protein